MEEDFIQIFVTVDEKDTADEIAETLVSEKLAACVQITSPIKSTYTWKGEIEISEEWILIIKSKISLYEDLETEIKRLHTYETPEIIAHKVYIGNEDYLRWLEMNLR